ncbi:MAG TPA: glycoside hydrolase family 15 protein [Thermoplasmata archaeon]|nr:glycoside hydrolase family 15 protein [Thermoplasmata archaeon]
MQPRGDRTAFGGPGIEPRWSHSNKDGVGTAYSADSRLWYTLWRGTVTEVYYPRIDRPQLRDLEFLFTDGGTLFHEEKRHLVATTERSHDHALGFTVRSEAPEGRYRLTKWLIGDPHQPCLLVRARLEILDRRLVGKLRLFALVAPHLEVGGWGNHATVYNILGRSLLAAEKGGTALAVGCTSPFVRTSVGYVGASDGWTDISQHGSMAWEFDRAPDGNVALTGEIPLEEVSEFTLGLAFGDSIQSAATTLYQSLTTPFELHQRRFLEQWNRTATHQLPLSGASRDRGKLYRSSCATLLAHEDKLFPGAFIASLSIPWGASRTDVDRGGYHLVWTRDMAHSAMGLLASGSEETALRALVYLATQQRVDGGFPQNFWVDGTPYWQGIQLDEVALPILLAAKLKESRTPPRFDSEPMVLKGARFLIENGPATQQDRWEEVGGYSPSTLATSIAALTVASGFARARGDVATAEFVQAYADFLDAHVERWTVTSKGTLVKAIPRHYVRIRPASMGAVVPDEGPDLGLVRLPNVPPGTSPDFPASDIVDAGFLDLVRYGVRALDDPTVTDSVRVVDRVLRVETPFGPAWRRFNHDGYGQRDDGGPYADWGQGRAWPVLTGERGHYELAAGRDTGPYLEAMERFATPTGLLTEQVWDAPNLPELHLELGRPTEAAMPLAWAHAEYVELLRSVSDGAVFDRVPAVAERYLARNRHRTTLEFWKFNRQPATIPSGSPLRVVAGAPFRLRVSEDDWRTPVTMDSQPTGIGLHFVDLAPLARVGRSWRFTFYWPAADRWEGRDFSVTAANDPGLTPP